MDLQHLSREDGNICTEFKHILTKVLHYKCQVNMSHLLHVHLKEKIDLF